MPVIDLHTRIFCGLWNTVKSNDLTCPSNSLTPTGSSIQPDPAGERTAFTSICTPSFC